VIIALAPPIHRARYTVANTEIANTLAPPIHVYGGTESLVPLKPGNRPLPPHSAPDAADIKKKEDGDYRANTHAA